MPTYEYECRYCGFRTEYFQAMRDDPKKRCPGCGAADGLRRLIGCGGGIIFRGNGFYVTDYRSPEYKKRAKEENQGDAKAGSASTGKNGEGSKKTEGSQEGGDGRKPPGEKTGTESAKSE